MRKSENPALRLREDEAAIFLEELAKSIERECIGPFAMQSNEEYMKEFRTVYAALLRNVKVLIQQKD